MKEYGDTNTPFFSENATGYKIKKGEKALFVTKIWKPCKKSVVTDDGTKTETKKIIACKCYILQRFTS